MLAKLYNYLQILKSDLWFIPALFCFVSFCIILSGYYAETHYFSNLNVPEYFFQGSTDDAKSVIIALLSAMITMATLAISITIVVLSLAASQLGPRLIKSFMEDRKTKDFFGLFFGTVIACFVLTIILHSRTSEAVTPQMTISLVFGLCLVNLFVLLGFVNHVAQSCIADNIILKVSEDLMSALKRLTRDSKPFKKPEEAHDKVDWPKDFDQISTDLFFDRSGYVQNIHYEAIVNFAAKHDCRIHIRFKSGHFLVRGEDGVRLYTKSPLPDDAQNIIKDCFIVGEGRTATQDIEYSIRHLVEIAIRALSPGINDAFTAMHVLDQLSVAVAFVFEKETPSEHFYDEDGVKRLIARQVNIEDLIFSAFEQIRYNGSEMPSIIRHMVKTLRTLSGLTDSSDAKRALLAQADSLKTDLKSIDRHVADRDILEQDINDLIARLKI